MDPTELDALRARCAALEERVQVLEARPVPSHGLRMPTRSMFILAFIVLCIGAYLAYQYYLLLQDIISQFPASM
jgi:ABC-type transporter Mla maintaining outer membrane lipid asymmetry permease subunit MlaE